MSRLFLQSQASVLAPTLLFAMLGGCGSSKQNIVTSNSEKNAKKVAVDQDAGTSDSSSDATVSNCQSKSDCPPVAADVSATFSANGGGLVGFVNQPVQWEFHGVDRNTLNADQQTSVRRVMVLLNKIPQGASVNPAVDSGALSVDTTISWTPTTAQTGTLDIILRDYDRCLMNESTDFCNQYVMHEAYDTKAPTVNWQIVNQAATTTATTTSAAASTGQVVNVSNPNCGAPGTSQAQVIGGVLKMLSPIGFITTLISNMSNPAPSGPTKC